MTMKKVIALVLAVTMLCASLVMLVACADEPAATTAAPTTTGGDAPTTTGQGTPTTTAPVVTTKPEDLTFDPADLDLSGETITFVIADTDGDKFNNRSIFADEDTGDPVDLVINERNEEVMEHFGCELAMYEEYTSDYSVGAKYGDLLLSNTDEIDIIAGRQWDDMQLATKGYMKDLSKLGDYINVKKPYWSTEYIESMNYGDSIYWLVGDLNLRFTGGFYTVFVNTELYNQSCAATYGEDLYDIVYKGNWTYDTVIGMAQLGWRDIGDKQDVTDEGDTLGLSLPMWDNTNAMVVSAGIPFGIENADGTITNNIKTTNQRLSTFINKIGELINTKGVMANSGNYGGSMQLLASNAAMMVFGRLNQAELYLKDMDADYVILPYPKLNAEQEDYYSTVHDGVSIFGINASSNNIEGSAAVLEYLAYLSYTKVRGEYYDYALKYRYTRDDKAAEMIDFIAKSATSDIVYVWCFSNDFNKVVGLGGGLFRANLINTNTSYITREMKKAQASWQTACDNLVADFEELWANEG